MMLSSFQKNRTTSFIPFVVAGYPSLKHTEVFVDILVKTGADIIELGVPFTDAMADGPVIQLASEAAANSGVSLAGVIEFAQTLRKKYPSLGLVLFSYYNPILKMGLADFSKRAVAAGINSALAVDLPPEAAADYCRTLSQHNLGTIFLVAPSTTPARVALIDRCSSEFVYYVSRFGVTGAQSTLSESLVTELEALRKLTAKPIVVGFGISTGAQASSVAPYVEGVVVGSAFVKLISESGTNDVAMAHAAVQVEKLAREIKVGVSAERW